MNKRDCANVKIGNYIECNATASLKTSEVEVADLLDKSESEDYDIERDEHNCANVKIGNYYGCNATASLKTSEVEVVDLLDKSESEDHEVKMNKRDCANVEIENYVECNATASLKTSEVEVVDLQSSESENYTEYQTVVNDEDRTKVATHCGNVVVPSIVKVEAGCETKLN